MVLLYCRSVEFLCEDSILDYRLYPVQSAVLRHSIVVHEPIYCSMPAKMLNIIYSTSVIVHVNYVQANSRDIVYMI